MTRQAYLLLAVCTLVFGFTFGVLWMLEQDRMPRPPGPDVVTPEPTPIEQNPVRRFLDSIEGTAIVYFSTSPCPPCVTADRELVPWMQRQRWTVVKKTDPIEAETLGVTSFPTFIAVRNHRDVGRVSGCDRYRLTELLQAARGDRVDVVGTALATHVLSHRPAGAMAMSAEEQAVEGAPVGAGNRPAAPVLTFPFGPSLSLLDMLQKYAGQEFSFGIATVRIPKGIKWTAKREKDHVHLDLQPNPSIGFTRRFRDAIALDAVDVTIDRATLILDGFPDFSVRFAW